MSQKNLPAFLANHAAPIELLLFVSMITALWCLENLISGNFSPRKIRHASLNAMFLLSALPVQLMFAPLIIGAVKVAAAQHWGLVYFLPHPGSVWIRYVVMFFLLDLLDYAYHFAMHENSFLWRFHAVHHCDQSMDVSTNLREHPCESVMRNMVLLAWIFLTGASFWILFVRQIAQTIANISQHTSFRLPTGPGRFVGMLLVTPNLHHVHHHFRLPHTNRNYGDVFSIWDRIFGTFAELPEEETVFGLDTHFDERITMNYRRIVGMPFKVARPPAGGRE